MLKAKLKHGYSKLNYILKCSKYNDKSCKNVSKAVH